MKLLRTLAALALFTLAACGGAKPVALAEIAVFPEATEIQTGESAMADLVAQAMQTSVGGNLTAEARLYRLPADSTWEDVRSFYAGALEAGDWEASAELDSANEALSTAGWQRGSQSGRQVLMVGYTAPLPDEGPALIVALYGEAGR